MWFISTMLFLVAALALLGGFCNWTWAMDWVGGEFYRKILGKTGARVFFVLLGLAVLAGAVYSLDVQRPFPNTVPGAK